MATTSGQLLGEPLTDPSEVAKLEASHDVLFPSFNASIAFDLGIALRNRILALPHPQRRPAVVSIASANGNHVLFQAATESGTLPDNEEWIRRKRNVVLRFGVSTWAMRRKMLFTAGAPESQVEAAFAQKYGLKSTAPNGVPDDYAIHGGGFPIKVAGVDQVVGVIVVSGLKQEHDHQVIVELVQEFLKGKN